MHFDDAFRSQLRDLLIWRRDVRHFRTDPLPAGTVEQLIDLACLAPSVGLSQPWRFVVVDDAARRRAVLDDFSSCNLDALKSYSDERAAQYVKLKLAGLREAPCQLAIFADPSTDVGHGLGRRTMPEMAEYSESLPSARCGSRHARKALEWVGSPFSLRLVSTRYSTFRTRGA